MAGEENYGEAAYELAIADISSDQNAANVTEVRAEQMKKNSMFQRKAPKAITTENNPDNFTTSYIRMVQEMISQFKAERTG